MNLNQLLLALRVRYKIVLLTLAVTVVATILISLWLPKTYQASTSLVINAKGIDSVTGLSVPSQMLPGFIATQADILRSKAVALRAVDELKLADSPDVQRQFAASGNQGSVRDWLADLLMIKLDVVPSRDSSVMTINFRGSDPQFVAAVANAFATAYMQFSVQLKTDPAQQASSYITTRSKMLREQYEAAQSRLSKYQKDNNIYSADNRVDVETSRLNDLSTQLVAVQGQAMEANSRSRNATGNAGTSPDVQNNSLILGLKSSLALAEAKLADLSSRLAPNHPQYISAKSEVDKLRSTISEQVVSASAGVSSNARILEQREAELRAALSAQKMRVLELNGARDEFTVLTNEAENARRAYESATLRFNQTNLESESKQSDIAVLSAASAPSSPAGPRVLLNTALSVVVGLILGVGAVLLLELLDQRVRSSTHLAEAFGVPVLGVIEKARPLPGPRKLRKAPEATPAIQA